MRILLCVCDMRYTWAMTKKAMRKTDKRSAKTEVKYEPIKMGLAVAAAASACLVLFATIAVYS